MSSDQSHSDCAVIIVCLFVSFDYLNVNGSNSLVILFSFKKKIFRTFPLKKHIFKIEAF